MIRMVADLFEPHKIRQNQAPALDAIRDRFELLGQFGHGFFVEQGLLLGQRTPCGEFGFIGQIGNDTAVGF